MEQSVAGNASDRRDRGTRKIPKMS